MYPHWVWSWGYEVQVILGKSQNELHRLVIEIRFWLLAFPPSGSGEPIVLGTSARTNQLKIILNSLFFQLVQRERDIPMNNYGSFPY